jgi:hypothetical protein
MTFFLRVGRNDWRRVMGRVAVSNDWRRVMGRVAVSNLPNDRNSNLLGVVVVQRADN